MKLSIALATMIASLPLAASANTTPIWSGAYQVYGSSRCDSKNFTSLVTGTWTFQSGPVNLVNMDYYTAVGTDLQHDIIPDVPYNRGLGTVKIGTVTYMTTVHLDDKGVVKSATLIAQGAFGDTTCPTQYLLMR